MNVNVRFGGGEKKGDIVLRYYSLWVSNVNFSITAVQIEKFLRIRDK